MSDAMATYLAILIALQAVGLLCTAMALTANLRLLFDISLHMNSMSSSLWGLLDEVRSQKTAVPEAGDDGRATGTIHLTDIVAPCCEMSGRSASRSSGSHRGAPTFGTES